MQEVYHSGGGPVDDSFCRLISAAEEGIGDRSPLVDFSDNFSADGFAVSDSAMWRDRGFVRSTDISFAISRRFSRKSCGVDGIPDIALKRAGEVVFTFLSILFNHFINMAYTKSVWKEAMLIPILKRGLPLENSLSFSYWTRLGELQRRDTSLGTANLALRGDIPPHTP